MGTFVWPLVLLVVANVFMFVAWYGHLKLQDAGISTNWPVWVIVLFSWGIALIEYCFQVPANRMGYDSNGGPYSLLQLKVIQEVITLVVFIIMSLLLFNNFTLRWNHLVAFALLIAAVYFAFR